MIIVYNQVEPTRTPKVIEWPQGYSFAVVNRRKDRSIIAVLCYCKTPESANNQSSHWNGAYPNEPGAKCEVVARSLANERLASAI